MFHSPPTSRAALRRLLIVLVIALGVMIYAYGWTVTDIDLEVPQEAKRQQSVQLAMRDLLSPRIFEQDRELHPTTAAFLVNCDSGEAPSAPTSSDEPFVVISPTCGAAGDVVTVKAYNFAPNVEARIRWIPHEGQRRPREVLETGREEITLDASGSFEGSIEVPRISGSEGKIHQVEFVAAVPSGAVRFSSITDEVIRRMAETIFMALVATTLAIPISFLLSFFAAGNLMHPVRTPMGTLMVAVIALPLGWLIGARLLGVVGRVALNLGQAEFEDITAVILPLTVLFGTVAASRMPHVHELGLPRAILNQVVVIIGATFLIGFVGGLMLLISPQLVNLADSFRPENNSGILNWLINALADGVAAIGKLLELIGGFIDLFIKSIAGLLGAFGLVSIATRLGAVPMRQIVGLASHALGGVLGIPTGMIIMAAVAGIAKWAAMFGLFPPLAAALLGSQVLLLLYRWAVWGGKQKKVLTQQDRLINLLLMVIGALPSFVFTFWYLKVGRSLIDGTLPAANTVDVLGIEIGQYLWKSLQIGAVLGGMMGLMAGTEAPFMIGTVLYNITRNILNALRSIEPLIMGLIFVIWVGIGPFAGVLALTLHSIASLGKLYSEQIESIDEGPIEALKATGASHLQTIIYAVVPQIIPPYIAFTMYRWDINVRMSTIIGFVGGGGIGLLLNQQINLLRYRDAGVAVLAIAIVVSLLDYASASIRERAG